MRSSPFNEDDLGSQQNVDPFVQSLSVYGCKILDILSVVGVNYSKDLKLYDLLSLLLRVFGLHKFVMLSIKRYQNNSF